MKGRHHLPPGRSPDEDKETYTAPKDELGTSDEVVMQGRQDYATEKVPRWPAADSARQYIATPEGKLEIQHGVVTWPDAARCESRNWKTSSEGTSQGTGGLPGSRPITNYNAWDWACAIWHTYFYL